MPIQRFWNRLLHGTFAARLLLRSMTVSREEVRRIAKLARLRFTDEEESALAKDMARILDYMATLNEVDTTDVEPMTHVQDLAGVVREDRVVRRMRQREALAGAPDTDGTYFRVPKVIGQAK